MECSPTDMRTGFFVGEDIILPPAITFVYRSGDDTANPLLAGVYYAPLHSCRSNSVDARAIRESPLRCPPWFEFPKIVSDRRGDQ